MKTLSVKRTGERERGGIPYRNRKITWDEKYKQPETIAAGPSKKAFTRLNSSSNLVTVTQKMRELQ